MKVALLIEGLNIPGGVRKTAIEMFKILRNMGHDVKFLVREHLDLKKILSWINDTKLATEIIENPIYVPRYSIHAHLIIDKFDLIINCKANEILSLAHIQYFHGIPSGIIRQVVHDVVAKPSKLVLINFKIYSRITRTYAWAKRCHCIPAC